MVNGVLYTTAGTRRSVVALDAATGELLLGARGARRRARGGVAAPAVGPRRGVLDRRPGRAHPLRHHRLPPRRARREDRRAHPLVRQGRHRRSEGRRGVRQGAADRSRGGRDRAARDAGGHQGRRRDDRRGDARGRHAEDAQQHQGPGARLRRAHRPAAVDVQHDSAPRRVRQRHVAERFVGGERQRRRLEPDRRRRGARARVPAGRDAELRFLRRTSARQQPVRREPRRDRLQDRQAQVALPARAPSDLEHGHRDGADARRSHRRAASR